jgi:hypothetical protein
MTDEVVFHHGTTPVRRLHLDPGEAMPCHRDPFHRVAVVLSGYVLLIQYYYGDNLRVRSRPVRRGRLGRAECPCASSGESASCPSKSRFSGSTILKP